MAEIYHYNHLQGRKRQPRGEAHIMGGHVDHYHGNAGVADQLKSHRRRKEDERKLEALDQESQMLRKLIIHTDDDDRRFAYTEQLAAVDSIRIRMHHQP